MLRITMLRVKAVRLRWILTGALAVLINFTANAEQHNPPAFSYLLHCSGCHIEDGRGDPPEVPDLRKDLDLLLSSVEGRSYMLRVPGVTDTPITTQEMADLMNWMIAKFYPELEGFKQFSAGEVQAGRDNRLANPLESRKQIISSLSD